MTRRDLSIPALWVLGAFVIALTSWLGPNLASAKSDLFTLSPFVHYGLSVALWFLVFAGAYLLIERLRLPFGRRLASVHFGLMASGSALILFPVLLVGRFPEPVGADESILLFRLVNGVSTFGYSLTLLGLLVFVGAFGRSIWMRMTNRSR